MRRVVPVVLILALLAGCGVETQPSAETDPPTSVAQPPATTAPAATAPAASPAATVAVAKAAFVRDFNAICRSAEQRVNELDEPQGIDDIPGWLRGFISILDELQPKLRALVPPTGDADEIDRYLDGNDEQIAAVKAALPEVEAGAQENDEQRVEAALDEAFMTFGGIAAEQEPFVQSYGLTDCGEKDTGPTTQA